MRIIHTSDWHIGRRFEREPLEADQRAFLAWLAGQVQAHTVALVVVAGDIYDRSMPAEDAVDLLDVGLDGLRAAGAEVVLIPGNHDSARRLGFGATRQALGGVHVFADITAPPAPWRFSSGGDEIAVVAVPFLDPMALPSTDGSPGPRTHGAGLAAAMAHGRRALHAVGGSPSVAVAHGTVAGGWPSDSEKALSIGGADVADPASFAGFDYVALGHLHRPQLVGGDPTRAYSGSPLPYSFSETQPKSVRLIEIGGGGAPSVAELAIPVGRPVATLEDSLEAMLDDPVYDSFAGHFVAARLTDTITCVAPMERLQQRFPHIASVRYATAPHRPGGGAGPGSDAAGAGGRSPVTVVCSFLSEVEATQSDRQRQLLAGAVDAAVAEPGP